MRRGPVGAATEAAFVGLDAAACASGPLRGGALSCDLQPAQRSRTRNENDRFALMCAPKRRTREGARSRAADRRYDERRRTETWGQPNSLQFSAIERELRELLHARVSGE